MKKLFYTVILVFLVITLSACKSGGSGSGSSSKTFTVSLDSVDVRQVSNGNVVNVNVSGVNSGTLTLD